MSQTYADELIPSSYESWRYCIEEKCGIELTERYLRDRIEALADERDEYTRRYRRLYGDQQWQRVRSWFEKALQETIG
ncbi:hypothetical protein CAI21_18565 [Alkalilimnicola ehrlichii]|uniref:Uncharacterized protein n=1 Tax=Alkalilimnicola ehrlichii TaxID=351052 RepID=A0A3E0WK43_9GAMM|nr:hypothetical protein [Alkalilimnicola ehrlichii]RFA25768.1 hypothetical protein CAI21_18565 [Alkalilimnicola ehrlichii]RFA32849.1 hypothetical protein CAL65_18820 [Alkalilimnicola ehrlichii]